MEIYVEPVLPVARLLLFGSSPTVRVLARIGHATGYRVDVVDPDADKAAFPEALSVSRALSSEGVPPGAHVLVATMGERDLEAIEAAIGRSPAYLGVIASPKRFALLRDALLARGVSRAALARIVAPAGLDIGARTPEEIAVSIMAQIVERRRAAAKAEEPATVKEPATVEESSERTIREAIDPVCGMTVTIAGAAHTAEAQGEKYYFCCAGCRAKFLADSSRYIGSRSRLRGS